MLERFDQFGESPLMKWQTHLFEVLDESRSRSDLGIPLQIRRYIPGEEGAIWAVYFGSTRNVVAKEYTPDQVQRWAPDSPDWESWAGACARTNPFVAVINGRLVGFAELESDGHINNFYCHHEFQRQGIGTALFRALEQEAIRLGLPALFAEVSTTGIKFFIAQGFDIEEERCNIVCNAPARQFIVRKRLTHADAVPENGANLCDPS
jgi:GNAT superfamily N-acetyltransferase